ncbi:hypothetical protein ACFXB3_11785, partial [Streptomyces sp. NPDC059447]
LVYVWGGCPGGFGILGAKYGDAVSLARWPMYLEHQAAMKQGRSDWYESYTLHVGTVERSHGFDRDA